MKKIKYNPRIMKKTILIFLLALVVGWFGFSVVKSFISDEITTSSKQLQTSIPAGDYRDYLLESVGLTASKYDDSQFDLFQERLNSNQPTLASPIVLSYEDAVITEGGDSFYKGKTYETNEGKSVSGYYTADEGTLEWKFNVEKAGLYNIKIEYLIPTAKNGGSNAERSIKVNGELLFDALGSISFYRIYKDGVENIAQDLNGNDIKPSQVEIGNVLRNEYLQDNTGYVQDPYLVYFNAGENSISISNIREELVIVSLEIHQTNDYDVYTYTEYLDYYQNEKNAVAVKDVLNLYQAEDSSIRKASSPTLYPISDRNSSANTPGHPVLQKYNAIGGSKWSTAGDYIEWDVEVPEAGLYNIAFRTKQDQSRGLFTTRKLYVNGEVPFREAENCRFFYNSKYSITKLGDTEGNPYYVYLEAGKNTLRLQATVGDYSDLISQVQIVVNDLNNLYLKIIAITTANPDEYQDYKLYGDGSRLTPDANGRDMQTIFSDCAIMLNNVSKGLVAITGEKSTFNNTLDELVLQIGGMIDGKDVGGFATNPRNVTKDLAAFKTNLSSLGTWMLDIKSQSLTVESFVVYSDNMESELPKSEDNIFKSTWFAIRGFFLSFFFDYESVGVTTESSEKEIEVWYLADVSSGREQCNAIKSLIDQTFIPQTGINVVLKIVAGGVLLPATLAGTGPDVAINVDGGLPVNYALRHAVYDISQFDDYDEVIAERFLPDQMIPFTLEHPAGSATPEGVYGLPNTMSFYVMFYRTDIFEANGWEVPATWDDVIDLVTDMQVSNLEFYMPLEGDGGTMFATLLYQSGGEYYKDRGIESALKEEVSLKTFEQWCSFFTDYSFALSANFSNRFRSGEMPIGIASYTLFNTLAVFAPDIAGKWAFAKLPGQVIVPDDPTTSENEEVIDNSTILGQTAVVIMEQSEKKDEAWEFLKWWSKTETQTTYAKEMESILGSAARHNTANYYAVGNLAWTKEEIDIIQTMWREAKGVEGVAGGYYIGRNLENSIREVINNDSNPRETFKEYIEQIDAELTRKREEFGLPTLKKGE